MSQEVSPIQNIIFLGSKEVGYAALTFLLKNASSLGIKVIGALTNDRSISDTQNSIKQLCQHHNIPVLEQLDDLLHISNIDYLISVQYHEILKLRHIETAKKLAINLHMAPLPEYRGCNQFSFAIIDDVREFGTTIHVLNTGIDSGDIICEKRFEITNTETVQSLHTKTTQKSIQLFEENIGAIIQGHYKRIPQGEIVKSLKSFHLRSEIHDIKKIDISWDESKIDRYVRATYFPPFPPPYAMVKGKKVNLSLNWKSEIATLK